MAVDPLLEHEANYFALCLLLPEDMVRAEVRKLGGLDLSDPRAFVRLARIFEVDATLMAFRLGQLWVRPGMRRRWTVDG